MKIANGEEGLKILAANDLGLSGVSKRFSFSFFCNKRVRGCFELIRRAKMSFDGRVKNRNRLDSFLLNYINLKGKFYIYMLNQKESKPFGKNVITTQQNK